MRKRKGFLLLEALLGLLILSALGAAFFPAIGLGARALDMVGHRSHMESEGTFAMDFMVGKIRRTLQPTTSTSLGAIRQGDGYAYRAYNENHLDKKYTLYLDGEKIKLELYNGRVQPVTGTTTSGREEYAFERIGETPIFSQEGQGPVHISYRVRHASGEVRDYETSLVTYADYYRKGDAGW